MGDDDPQRGSRPARMGGLVMEDFCPQCHDASGRCKCIPSQPVEQEVMYCYRSDGAYIGEWREDGFHLDTSVVAPPEQREDKK